MISPSQLCNFIKEKLTEVEKKTFVGTFLIGLLIHLPIMVRDIPNHDGLASMYFDQNMITSGRWFLTIACGFSSYFTIPWLIGIICLLFLAGTAVLLSDFFQVKTAGTGIGIGALLVAFPSLCAGFGYVFTLDGYMMALFLAVLAALLVEKGKYGFLAGGVSLAFSLGIYQAYLPFTMLLCFFGVCKGFYRTGFKEKKDLVFPVKYVGMGAVGMALYYCILQILLRVQGKQLSNYQGINEMTSVEKASLLETIGTMYRNFLAFTIKGNVFTNNIFSKVGMVLLLLLGLWGICCRVRKNKLWSNPWLYILTFLFVVLIPLMSNVMLLISPGVNYHVLMRYHYVLLPMVAMALAENGTQETKESKGKSDKANNQKSGTTSNALYAWGLCISCIAVIFSYVVTDQIAYSNLQKKYEKTYAYCSRLLDRIEQTPRYEVGMPIAMIGVVGEESYPVTDLTEDVTDGIIGMSGDYLLYTGENYKAFMENYLGATLNILPADAMAEAYYEDFYREMGSFPAADSILIWDGVMYIKTENKQ